MACNSASLCINAILVFQAFALMKHLTLRNTFSGPNFQADVTVNATQEVNRALKGTALSLSSIAASSIQVPNAAGIHAYSKELSLIDWHRAQASGVRVSW